MLFAERSRPRLSRSSASLPRSMAVANSTSCSLVSRGSRAAASRYRRTSSVSEAGSPRRGPLGTALISPCITAQSGFLFPRSGDPDKPGRAHAGPRPASGSRSGLVHEDVDGRLGEGGEVVWLPAGHQGPVPMDLFVDPRPAGVPDVRSQAGP